MVTVVNLRTARKAKARAAARAAADANAAKFGRTSTEKALTAAEARRAARDLDGKRIAPGSGSEGNPPDKGTN